LGGWIPQGENRWQHPIEPSESLTKDKEGDWTLRSGTGIRINICWDPKKESFDQWFDEVSTPIAKPEQRAAEPNAIYNNAAKAENAKDTLPLRPTEVIEKAGWSWDAYGQVYRKDNCKWEVSLLPFWSMIACRCDGKEITHWTFWKPQGSKSFVEWLKEFDN